MLRSITELPESVISELSENAKVVIAALEENAEEMWAWVSVMVYGLLMEQAADHLLVKLMKRFDFSQLEKECAEYQIYERGKRGREPTHTIGQYCRALLVKCVYSWSYAKTAEEMRGNLLVRSFVGYKLNEVTMDGSTLYRFEKWVKEKKPRLFFDEMLKQIEEDFPEERGEAQMGDTFAMRARARVQTRIEMMREASERMLDYLKQVAPEVHERVMAKLDKELLFGTEEEKPEQWLKKEERQARKERTAIGASRCLSVVEEEVKPLKLGRSVEAMAFETWMGYLAKILKDEFTFQYDETGEVIQATQREKHVKGAYAMASMKDPDATFRKHNDKSDFGYNINLAATQNFVYEIAAATGAVPDVVGVPKLVKEQVTHLGSAPHKLIYDSAAGTAKCMQDVYRTSGQQTQLVTRLINYTKNSNRFTAKDFTLDEYGDLTCPNGVSTQRAYRSTGADGYNYRYLATQCEGCPLMAQCRDPKSKPTSHRQVFISDYILLRQEAIAYTQTPEFEADMKFRSNIERVIAGVARYNGARDAKSYGLDNADYQAKMSATAYNLKRWAVLIEQKEAPNKVGRVEPQLL